MTEIVVNESKTVEHIHRNAELQPLGGKACRICRDGERYLIREESA